MNVEGSVHVIWLHRQAENETPIFAVTWSPYATDFQGGAMPTVKRAGVESLHDFLRDEIGLSEKSNGEWAKELETEGEISIPNVILDSDVLKKVGLGD